jgi:hypothetical protein
MRLTLRTLLAYLDDTLEPAQARLIGEKVAESDAAQELIARIKQVTRRRRLTTPPAAGPGSALDINQVAAYLDNELPPEQLAEVEEICLASDVHLAEIAACHQILTLVLGEPILIPPTARQRMYTLIKGREAIPNRSARATGIGQGAQEIPVPGGNGDADLLGASGGRAAWPGWLMPVIAASLLVAAIVAISQTLHNNQPPSVAERNRPGESPPVESVIEQTSPVELPPPADKGPPPGKTSGPAAEARLEPLPAPRPEPPVDKGAAEKKPEKPKITGAAPPAVKGPASPTAERTSPPANDRRELGQYVLVADAPSVFVQRTGGAGPWQRLKPQSAVHGSDYLVSLPGYRSELWLDSGARLQLWGSLPEFSGMLIFESAVTLHPPSGVDVDFTVERGVVVLSNHKKEGPMVARVRFADEIWDITLPDSESVVGVHLDGQCMPFSRQPHGGEPILSIAVLALRGPSTVRTRSGNISQVAPAFIRWDNVQGAGHESQHMPQPPSWWTNKALAQGPLQAALDGLTKRLLSKQQGNSLEISLAEMINDRDSANRELAVHCLGALNDWPDLLDALSDGQFADVRGFACGVLRHLLGLSPNNDQVLVNALGKKNFSANQARTVVQLLHGFGPDLWSNPATQMTTVEYLLHDKLAIRQVAHLLLQAQIPEGQRIRYDPAGEVAQRERGYQAWRDLVSGKRAAPKQQQRKIGPR